MNVGEDSTNVVPALQNANGFVRIRGCYGVEPSLFDHFERSRSYKVIILHHQHDWRLTGSHSAHLQHPFRPSACAAKRLPDWVVPLGEHNEGSATISGGHAPVWVSLPKCESVLR